MQSISTTGNCLCQMQLTFFYLCIFGLLCSILVWKIHVQWTWDDIFKIITTLFNLPKGRVSPPHTPIPGIALWSIQKDNNQRGLKCFPLRTGTRKVRTKCVSETRQLLCLCVWLIIHCSEDWNTSVFLLVFLKKILMDILPTKEKNKHCFRLWIHMKGGLQTASRESITHSV